MRRRTAWMVVVAGGVAVAAGSAAVVAAHTAVPTAAVASCRATQLRFQTPLVQPISSVFVGYSLTMRNVSDRPCALGHLLFVRLPSHSPATIDVKPQLKSGLLPPIDLSHRLVVRPGKAVGTYVLVASPCSGVRSSVEMPIAIGADAPPSSVKVTITIRACRAAANEIHLPPLTNV